MGSVQARGKGRDGNGYWMTLYGLERERERKSLLELGFFNTCVVDARISNSWLKKNNYLCYSICIKFFHSSFVNVCREIH